MSKKVAINIDDAIRILNPDNILFFSTDKFCCVAHLKDGTSESVPLNIEFLEDTFTSFFRINHDNLINLMYLSYVSEHEQGYVIIDQHVQLLIDQDRKQLLFETLKQFI